MKSKFRSWFGGIEFVGKVRGCGRWIVLELFFFCSVFFNYFVYWVFRCIDCWAGVFGIVFRVIFRRGGGGYGRFG